VRKSCISVTSGEVLVEAPIPAMSTLRAY